jgi:hypothetical protein
LPIVITVSGIVMAAREEQLSKAPLPIDVTPSRIVMAAREEHAMKAVSPIDVTPFAKVTSVSSRSYWNLSLPEYTADLGILRRIWEGFGKDSGRMKVVVLIALKLDPV